MYPCIILPIIPLNIKNLSVFDYWCCNVHSRDKSWSGTLSGGVVSAALCTVLLDLTSGSGLNTGAQMIPSNFNHKLN